MSAHSKMSDSAVKLVFGSLEEVMASVRYSLAMEDHGALLGALWEAVRYLRAQPQNRTNKIKYLEARVNQLAHGWTVQINFPDRPSIQCDKQGSACKVRRWAILKPLASKVTLLEPIGRAAWHRAHGHGGRHDGKY